MPVDLTPTTRRLIIGSLALMCFGVIVGWAIGTIESKDAMLIVVSTSTGFFSLLKGVE